MKLGIRHLSDFRLGQPYCDLLLAAAPAGRRFAVAEVTDVYGRFRTIYYSVTPISALAGGGVFSLPTCISLHILAAVPVRSKYLTEKRVLSKGSLYGPENLIGEATSIIFLPTHLAYGIEGSVLNAIWSCQLVHWHLNELCLVGRYLPSIFF